MAGKRKSGSNVAARLSLQRFPTVPNDDLWLQFEAVEPFDTILDYGQELIEEIKKVRNTPEVSGGIGVVFWELGKLRT
jgi:hypothetical protein